MFIEKIKSEGLAHLSYLIGDKGQAVVIDPRRDIDVYMLLAKEHSLNIISIFETHRNEDYVIGSQQLRHRTDAEIYHGHQIDFEYGTSVHEGDTFEFGDVILKILSTPGHTFESISIALYDSSFSREEAIGIFTGDALFIGDVGRTDFFPDQARSVAGMLFDSIHEKILPLGDSCLLYPAHGAGSVCGSGMASREFSTVGYERRHNPMLQKSREEFIDYKINEHHYQPPYFKKMEELNQNGNAEILCHLPEPRPLTPEQFAAAMDEHLQVLDLRSPEALSGAAVPGSLGIPIGMVPAFAGYFLSYDEPIGLIAENTDDVHTAVRHLVRLGYDTITCFLSGGLHTWETSGRPYHRIPAVHAGQLSEMIHDQEPFTLLDVRSIDEFESGHLPGARHVYVGEIPKYTDTIPTDKPVITFCGSGRRAIIAASYLKQIGFQDVSNCLGSMKACRAVGCPIA